MRLSVVVVNWNSRDDLRVCLASLGAQSHRDLEIIVVDNGSTDHSSAMVSAEFPGCTLLCQPENLGFAEGCNRGIGVSTGSWIAANLERISHCRTPSIWWRDPSKGSLLYFCFRK